MAINWDGQTQVLFLVSSRHYLRKWLNTAWGLYCNVFLHQKNTILVGAHPKLYPGKICWNPMIVPCFIQQNNVPQILFYPASCGSLAFYHGFWGCVEHERRMGLSIKIHQLSHDGRFYYSWLPFISNTILIKKITFMKPIPSRMNRNTILIIRLIDGYRWYRVDGYWFHQY